MAITKPGEAAAFMPTPNDLLSPAVNGKSPSRLFSYGSPRGRVNGTLSSIKSRAASLDSYTLLSRSLSTTSEVSSTITAMASEATLPEREHVSSVSEIPATVSDNRSPGNQDFYHDLYNKICEAHAIERDVWNLERKKLKQDIGLLEAQLAKVLGGYRNDSGVSEVGFGSIGGTENDKVYGDPFTIMTANEKLRELSQVSPDGFDAGSRRASREPSLSENTGNPTRKSSQPRSTGLERLTSITEDEAQSPGGALTDMPSTDAAMEGECSNADSDYHILIAKVPVIMDEDMPLPLNQNDATFHRRHNTMDPDHVTANTGRALPATRLHTARASIAEPTPFGPYLDGVADSDRELSAPLMLTPTPEDNLGTLQTLHDRLTIVANHPTENRPAVLLGTPLFDSEQQPPTNGANLVAHPIVPGEVRLRTRRSMNFGAELGRLR